jgi:hypothetical protein
MGNDGIKALKAVLEDARETVECLEQIERDIDAGKLSGCGCGADQRIVRAHNRALLVSARQACREYQAQLDREQARPGSALGSVQMGNVRITGVAAVVAAVLLSVVSVLASAFVVMQSRELAARLGQVNVMEKNSHANP